MNILKNYTLLVAGLLLCTLSSAYAEDAIDLQKEVNLGLNQNLSAQTAARKSNTGTQNSRKLYLTRRSKIGCTPTYFYNMSLGVGFLRFSGQKGSDAYASLPSILKTRTPLYQGGTGYNRTPLLDATLGWNPLSWMGLGIAYVGQHNVIFERNLWSLSTVNTSKVTYYFRANVDLNAAVAKAFFYLPHSIVWRAVAISPFMAFAVGPGWQTWTPTLSSPSSGTTVNFRQKVSANCFFMADSGFQVKSMKADQNLSMIFGLKFNIWGQARSMGALDQQRIRTASQTPINDNVGLLQPFSIRTVYQFAPYLGVMWSY